MRTAKPTDNKKIAIVGMNAHFGEYISLDAFERSIYEGHSLDLNNTEPLSAIAMTERFDRVASIALEDAAISLNANIAVVVAKNSQHTIDSSLVDRVTEASSVIDALSIARELLSKGEVEAVLVGGVDFVSQAVGAVVLKSDRAAKQDRHKIYAAIDSLGSSTPIEAIAYLEVVAEKRLEEVEIEQRIPSYLATNSAFSCAVSSVTNAGYKGIAGEIASLIKTALCLYYRYIPPVAQWNEQISKNCPLYVATFAKPWFLEAGVDRRVAAINFVDNNAHIILSEETDPQRRSHAYLEQTPCYLFPLTANDSKALLARLDLFKRSIKDSDLSAISRQTFIEHRDSEGDYVIAIVGKNRAEILKECDRAVKGVTKAFETGKDWQTPVGSYFTAKPQGKEGKIAFVYPGAYNAHVGLGKDLFRLFPNLIDDPVIKSTCNRTAGIEKLLYPRSWHQLTPRELETKERELMNDALAMLESETGFAGFITTILRDCFQVKPQAAFGYSLGETSMMYAQGVWSDIDRTSDVLNTSPLFKTRLAGKKEAVREHWQLSEEQQGELWRTYVVMANSDLIEEKLQAEDRVYLTQISTPKEAVIAGDPQSCERVIKRLGCDAFRAPFNHVIHCEAMQSEYDELIKLNTLPVQKSPQLTFYSAANYQQINYTSQQIAHSVTQTLCQQLDFPRLVNRVYQDDYRIFIEVGVGSNCSRWIKDILKSQEHATVSLHRRGTNDFTSLIKALAKLSSHQVKLDLSPLYGAVKDSTQDKPVVNTAEVDPWQESTNNSALHHTGIAVSQDKGDSLQYKITSTSDRDPISLSKSTKKNRVNNNKQFTKNKVKLERASDNLILWQPNYLNSRESNISHNNSQLSKAHSLFIDRDREYFSNTKKMIGQYLEFLEKLLIEKN